MNKLRATVRYTLIGIIVIMLCILTWWYFFLETKQNAVVETERGRGLRLETPQFSSPAGNTYLNLVRSIPSTPLWREAHDTAIAVVDLFTDKKQGSKDAAVKQATLWHVSELPVAGMAFGAHDTTLRFIERATGHVLEAHLETKTLSRITNTTVPHVEEAYIVKDRVFIRTEERGVVTTVTALVEPALGTTLEQKRKLEDYITSVAQHPDDSITYIIEQPGKKPVVVSAKPDGTQPKNVTTLGTNGWDARSFNKNHILLVERPADDVSGYAIEVTPSGVSPLLRNLPGLTVQTHASSTSLLYGTSARGVLSLFSQKNSITSPLKLPLHTLADKCVFAPNGITAYCAQPKKLPEKGFLNAWYRGETHTSDSWWSVDTARGTAELFFDPELEDGVSLDVETPVMSEGGAYIAFRNAQDWSLWLLSLP